MNCKSKVGKLVKKSPNIFKTELDALVTKPWIVEPTSYENSSEAKNDGKTVFKGVTKSVSCADWYNLRVWLIIVGVKNQIGRMINAINAKQIIVAERFWDFVIFRRNLYTGEKIKASIRPKTIAIRIGFKTKKDKTKSIKKMIILKIFLKDTSAIILIYYNLRLKEEYEIYKVL